MKGIIFNLLEERVEDEGGPAAWDGLLDSAEVDGGYSAIGDYPTTELSALVGARARTLGLSDLEALRDFGHGALLSLAVKFPGFFTPHDTTRDFLLTLNDVIHPQVRKLHATARPPEFDFTVIGDDQLRMVYRSERRLCGMAEGMIAGAADHFGEVVDIVQDQCVLSGDDTCVLHCTFGERTGDAAAGS